MEDVGVNTAEDCRPLAQYIRQMSWFTFLGVVDVSSQAAFSCSFGEELGRMSVCCLYLLGSQA